MTGIGHHRHRTRRGLSACRQICNPNTRRRKNEPIHQGCTVVRLKHYRRGIVLIAISLVSLWVIVEKTMQQASSMLDKLATEGGAPDAGQIADLVTQTSNGSVTLATFVLAGCWLAGIVDAYWLGRKQGERERPLFR